MPSMSKSPCHSSGGKQIVPSTALAKQHKNRLGKFGGTIGRPTQVVTNYFKIVVEKPFMVYQHDVIIGCRTKVSEREHREIKQKERNGLKTVRYVTFNDIGSRKIR